MLIQVIYVCFIDSIFLESTLPICKPWRKQFVFNFCPTRQDFYFYNMISIEYLRKNNLIIYECISGSRSYGLDLSHSDTDIKGVFVLPGDLFYGLDYVGQVSNESNDIVFYELRKFIDLLTKNNPNILELLNIPGKCILYKHPLFEAIKPGLFLSKLCNQSFAGYAMSQIKKAKGLKKKIVNPVDKEKKSILDFCYIIKGQGTIPLKKWLEYKGFDQEKCGLVNIPHMKDIYAVFYDKDKKLGYRGMVSGDGAFEVSLSSIPKDAEPVGIMSYNKDGFSTYCKEYKEYWDWVAKRNDERYKNTISHGKNYDAKNMMHTFRLLNMAEEIARDKVINTWREDREYLLKIRKGDFLYADLVEQAQQKMMKIDDLFKKSDLPEKPDQKKIEDLLVSIRKSFYKEE